MAEEQENKVVARVGDGGRFSPIWLVPIVAVIIGVWMVYANWAAQGPMIEITFVSGEGIEAGKTKIKRKNVEIGEVKSLALSEDAQSVILTVRMNKESASLLREDTKFWVVRPRIGPGGVSGLNTLLSGAYIAMSLGVSEEPERSFVGWERPPVTPIGTPGLHVTLDSDGNRALNVGDPILFHGQQVGTIEYVHFNTEERRTYYNAFIEAPHDRLITSNTRFWFVNGLNVSLSADGVRFEMATLETFVAGGVAFDVPPGQPLGEQITERAFFTILPRVSAIQENTYEHKLRYVILFDDSIRGLKPGAPVEFRGVKVGEVQRTDIDYDEMQNLLDPSSRIPVMLELVPARFGYDDTDAAAQNARAHIDSLVANGLHGAMALGSYVTGAKYIELQYYDDEAHPHESFDGATVIPAVAGEVGRLLANLGRTIDAVNKLPLGEVARSATKALDKMSETLSELDTILEDDSSHTVLNNLNDTLQQFQQLAQDYSEGSDVNRDISRALQSMQQTLVELEPVLRNLRQKPNSLVFGKPRVEDEEPKGNQE